MSAKLALIEDERDCLQEMVNVAIGRAGDSLARFLNIFVNLSVPKIKLADADAAGGTLHAMIGGIDSVIAVQQKFSVSDSPLSGDGVVLFTPKTLEELVGLCGLTAEGGVAAQEKLLKEVTNIINSDCLSGLGEQLGVDFTYGVPEVLGHEVETRTLISNNKESWPQALLVEINYTLEQGEFRCNWLLLMPREAIVALQGSIKDLLGDD